MTSPESVMRNHKNVSYNGRDRGDDISSVVANHQAELQSQRVRISRSQPAQMLKENILTLLTGSKEGTLMFTYHENWYPLNAQNYSTFLVAMQDNEDMHLDIEPLPHQTQMRFSQRQGPCCH